MLSLSSEPLFGSTRVPGCGSTCDSSDRPQHVSSSSMTLLSRWSPHLLRSHREEGLRREPRDQVLQRAPSPRPREIAGYRDTHFATTSMIRSCSVALDR